MAFASVAARAQSSTNTNQTSHTVDLPTGIVSGSLLLLIFTYSVTGNTITLPAGWTAITGGSVEQTTGSSEGIVTAYRKATGSEGATITVTSSVATRSSSIVLRVRDHIDPATQAPQAANAVGVNGAANPPSLTPTGGAKDYLWIACGANTHAVAYSAAPSGYSNLTVRDSGTTGGGNTIVGTAERQLNSASEDPGAFTGADAAAEWAAVTIAVHPASAAPASVTWSWDLEAYISGSWTSIAADVMLRKQAVVATRGIDGSDITSRVASPGSLTCLLDNGESNSAELLGYYSPEHANMRANFGRDTLVRLKITYNSSSYYKWRGYITDLEPTPGRYRERVSSLIATDFMQRMVEQKLQALPVLENQRSDQVMDAILDNLAIAPTAVSLDTDKFTMPYALHSERDERTTAMGATQKLCQTVLAYAFIRGDTTGGETFVFQREESRAATPVAATLDDTMSGLKHSRSSDRKKNRLVGQIHPVRVDSAATTLLAYLDNEIPIDGGTTLTITLRFKDPQNLASRISAKDVVTSLTAGIHYNMSAFAGTTSGSDLNSSLTPVVTAGGNTVIIQLTNASGTRGHINKLDIFGRGIYLYSPVQIEVESGDGDKQLNYDFYYLADPHRARTFLTHLHARASAETPDVENVWFYADTNSTLMSYALDLDIGDRVAIMETATGLSGEYIINKVTYTLTTTRSLRVDWELEPADTHSYFILNSSELDGTDVLSPF